MSPPLGYLEDELVEQPTIEFLGEWWDTQDCMDEFKTGKSTLGRNEMEEVVIVSKLRPALIRLNTGISTEIIEKAIEELTRHRGMMSVVAANREVYHLLKDGVKVPYIDPSGERTKITVRIINWDNYNENDFFLASQFWIAGDYGSKRPDVIGFVNGIPLLHIELKTSHRNVKDAYDENFCDYRDTIPQLFWYSAFSILSNGRQSRIGTVTADWEQFSRWKKINSEGERGNISLETILRGTCNPEKFLDLVENFITYQEVKGGYNKILAKNHQYLGVNNAIESVKNIQKNQGKLGVFWHTQGSGKSFSMIFFAQKVLRKISGKYTFVVVTDALDLDDQIYKNFSRTGTITDKEARARSGEHLKQLLTEDHRYIFTLIQKFRTDEKGGIYPKLSDRNDIIVITDEAHRSQYDIFALNMRNALPQASFIGFTGTPLLRHGEEKTRETFGDYVSIYNFQQSIDDEATVPLYYENRKPELQVINPKLNEEIADILDIANLDPEQEKRLEDEFAHNYQLIIRPERLGEVAQDIVEHFMTRGYRGKAMVVSIDKPTAIRMYDNVQVHWKKYLEGLQQKLIIADEYEKSSIADAIKYMEETDMAVVVSKELNEIERMRKLGLNIRPHRYRMEHEELDEKFKDEKDHFRIVFVCAMWMTGFDVPSCSTIYLDKPMRNHTLMQTIARANRVFPEKENGLIIDYIGVFLDLQRALAIYAPGVADKTTGLPEGASPLKKKEQQMELLIQAIDETKAFCVQLRIDIDQLLTAEKFQRIKMLDEAVKAIILRDPAGFVDEFGDGIDKILINDESKQRFQSLAGKVSLHAKSIKPFPAINEYIPICTLFSVLSETIGNIVQPPDITDVMLKISNKLDESIGTRGFVIKSNGVLDLSKLDFEAIQKQFQKGANHTQAARLKTFVERTVTQMIQLNHTRMNFYNEYVRMVEEYNNGSLNVEEFFRQLTDFVRRLSIEDQRHIAENLKEEDLAIFDLLTKPDLRLTENERTQVKKVAQELLETLKREKLQLDWHKKRQLRAAIRLTIIEKLVELPDVFTPDIYDQKCELVYQHIFNSYFGEGKSVFASSSA